MRDGAGSRSTRNTRKGRGRREADGGGMRYEVCFLTCIQASQEAGPVVWYSQNGTHYYLFLALRPLIKPASFCTYSSG